MTSRRSLIAGFGDSAGFFLIGVLLLERKEARLRGRRRGRKRIGKLFLDIVEVILHRSLISARNFFLAQGALSIRLRRGSGFFILDFALAFDADAFQSDARHLSTG